MSKFNNLSIRVGLNESNKQMTSRYLSGLNQDVRDEMGVVCLFHLEDARQYALMAEKKVGRYGARKLLPGRFDSSLQLLSKAFGASQQLQKLLLPAK